MTSPCRFSQPALLGVLLKTNDPAMPLIDEPDGRRRILCHLTRARRRFDDLRAAKKQEREAINNPQLSRQVRTGPAVRLVPKMLFPLSSGQVAIGDAAGAILP